MIICMIIVGPEKRQGSTMRLDMWLDNIVLWLLLLLAC